MELSVKSHGKEKGVISVAYLQLREGPSATTKIFANGNAMADYDKEGLLIGVEVLGPCIVNIPERIFKLGDSTEQAS